MNTGKCPHCESLIEQVEVEDIDLAVSRQPKWKGFAYHCPACHKVLSIQMNPLSLDDDIVERIAKLIGK